MRFISHIVLALTFASCSHTDRRRAATPGATNTSKATKEEMTVLTGTTRVYSRDGVLEARLASPRLTLDAHGDVVMEERLSTSGAVETRKRFAGGRLVEEESFAANGKLDDRYTYAYDADGYLAEEVMTLGHGTPHGKWVHHRDDKHRLVARDFVKPDGRIEITETYTYDGKNTTMTSDVAERKYRYDDAGRVLHEEALVVSSTEEDPFSVDYAYDIRHRLVLEITRDFAARVRREVTIAYP